MANKVKCVNTFASLYAGLNETEHAKFSRIISKLLNETFIIKEQESDYNDYFFIGENADLFTNYFEIIDYELVLDKFNACIYIKTNLNRNRLRLKKFDTALVLILRSLFYIKKKEVTSGNEIYVSVDELAERIKTSQVFNDEPKLSKYVSALKKLRMHKIVDYNGANLNGETMVKILPSIQIIIPQENLEDINTRLLALNVHYEDELLEGGDDDEETNED